MPVPTRLANDGWWLCENPTLAPIAVPSHIHRGKAKMPSIAPPIPDVRPVRASLLAPRFAITLGLAALADWLFYNERIGISLTLFALVLTGCSLLANRGLK
jgi:hypothetical protein